MEKGKQKVIIDVDTGVDDAQAIMMALAASERMDILAITCVAGNTDVEQVCCNTLRVLNVCQRLDIPVYKGASTPLVCEPHYGREHHGVDGLGDWPDEKPVDRSLVQAEHAVTALTRLVSENKGEVMLITLAPLTNIAMAIRMDPEFGSKLKNTVIMGGNIEGRGNIAISAEFNFHFDPEAAYIVLDGLCSPIQILPWEPCFNNGISWAWYNSLLAQQDTALQRFHGGIDAHSTKRKKEVFKCEAYFSCDPAAMAVSIDPSCVVTSTKGYCTVELQGKRTRGQMVVDWMTHLGNKPNVEIITNVDIEKVKNLYIKMLHC